MLDWIISLSLLVVFGAVIFLCNSKMGTIRPDGRPQKLPWGFIMITCVFGIVLIVVHVMNLVGIETGPEHGPFSRF